MCSQRRSPSLFAGVETWPCGCPKGMTPHGAAWSDCIFSDEQKARWMKVARMIDADEREHRERLEAGEWPYD